MSAQLQLKGHIAAAAAAVQQPARLLSRWKQLKLTGSSGSSRLGSSRTVSTGSLNLSQPLHVCWITLEILAAAVADAVAAYPAAAAAADAGVLEALESGKSEEEVMKMIDAATVVERAPAGRLS